MGRTSKSVRILCLDPDLWESAEVQALIEKGHPVELPPIDLTGRKLIEDYDLVIGRKAWYCDSKHLKYLEKVTIPAARKRIDYRKETTDAA